MSHLLLPDLLYRCTLHVCCCASTLEAIKLATVPAMEAGSDSQPDYCRLSECLSVCLHKLNMLRSSQKPKSKYKNRKKVTGFNKICHCLSVTCYI